MFLVWSMTTGYRRSMDIFDKLGIEVFEGIYLLVIVVQVIFEWERYFKHGEIPFEFGCNKQFREVFFFYIRYISCRFQVCRVSFIWCWHLCHSGVLIFVSFWFWADFLFLANHLRKHVFFEFLVFSFLISFFQIFL